MWNQPVELKPGFKALVLDTEGLSSCNRDINIDTKIFTLSVILSSAFIYNCLNSIDEFALENLSLVVNLLRMLKKEE